MRFPDFFIIGAAKCGTTSLHKYLVSHPDIFMPELKEPEYYSKNELYEKNKDWYLSLFQGASSEQLVGEGSTTYSRFPHIPLVPSRIYKDNPNAKFIYVMREPVSRAYSHYRHHMRLGVTCTFEEAIEKDDIYIDCSKYIQQINQYLEFFPIKNFLFVYYEEFKENPKIILREILDHLCVKQLDLTASGQIFSNVTGKEFYIRSKTTKRLRKVSFINYIAEIMPQAIKDSLFSLFMRTRTFRDIGNELEYPRMSEHTSKKLIKYFAPYNKQLEVLINKTTPDIWHSIH